ncbi:MAG: hypothetical protein M1814_001857 [Vezdaea aestivalis]|nr:MAG: hypothetical protein M1814_001857 [Vezdaea aestivalis]
MNSASAFGSSLSTLSYLFETPDLVKLSNPKVGVAFKNLSKKDSTTKYKALEELQSQVFSTSVDESFDDGVLAIWAKYYPRMSIDTSSRVRALAHTLHGQIVAASGKDAAKYMPSVIGPWFAGEFDNDRSASKAARDSFAAVFATEKKVELVRKSYAASILSYCIDAILAESPKTLSDPRTVSPDDADVIYTRLAGSCIAVISDYIARNSMTKSEAAILEPFLQNKALWMLAVWKDPFVRKSIYALLQLCLEKQASLLEPILAVISDCFISKAMVIDQRGSVLDFSRSMMRLTTTFQTVWTEHFLGKNSPTAQLQSFISKGSRSGPEDFWINIRNLFEVLPQDVFPRTISGAQSFAQSIREGIGQRDEIASNLEAAWKCYSLYINRVSKAIKPSTEASEFLRQDLSTFLRSTLKSSKRPQDWRFGPLKAKICSNYIEELMRLSPKGLDELLADNVGILSALVISDLEERSYHNKQDALNQEGCDWFNITTALAERIDELTTLIQEKNVVVVRQITKLLVDGEGKSVGAAIILESALRQPVKTSFLNLKDGHDIFLSFLLNHVPGLLASPSSRHLINILYCFGASTFDADNKFASVWRKCVSILQDAPDSSSKDATLVYFFSGLTPDSREKVGQSAESASLVRKTYNDAVSGRKQSWPLFDQLTNAKGKDYFLSLYEHFLTRMLKGVVPDLDIGYVLSNLCKRLTTEDSTHALDGLESLARSGNTSLRVFLSSQDGPKLLSSLVFLSSSDDIKVSRQADTVIQEIERSYHENRSAEATYSTSLGYLDDCFKPFGPTLIPLETLISRSISILRRLSEEERLELFPRLLPKAEEWESSLRPHLDSFNRKSLSIPDPFTSVSSLLSHRKAHSTTESFESLQADAEGLTIPMRTGLYVYGLLQEFPILASLEMQLQRIILKNLLYTSILVNDNISVAGANKLWIRHNPEIEKDISHFATELESSQQSWLQNANQALQASISLVDNDLTNNLGELVPTALYAARALTKLRRSHKDTRTSTPDLEEAWLASFKHAKQSQDIFTLLPSIAGFRPDSPASRLPHLSRCLNEAISSLSGMRQVLDTNKALYQLLIAEIFITGGPSLFGEIPQQRLIFLLQNLCSWMESNQIRPASPLTSLTLDLLFTIFPLVKEIYGSHWSTLLVFVQQVWSEAVSEIPGGEPRDSGLQLPALFSSLRLYGALQDTKPSNEDLEECVNESREETEELLLKLFQGGKGKLAKSKPILGPVLNITGLPDHFDKPLRMVNEMLCYRVKNFDLGSKADTLPYFRLLYAESSIIQSTAFSLLHNQIPKTQEGASIEAALSKAKVELPSELLSLVVEAPTVEALIEDGLEPSVPLPIRGYLLGWILVFDHFDKASYQVRRDYVDALEQSAILTSLLVFIFSVLMPTHEIVGLPKYNPAKFKSISTYNLEETAEPSGEIFQLLTHIYYLCLLHVPGITKAWYLSLTSRPLSQNILSLTEKTIAPVQLLNELEVVSKHFEDPVNNDDEAFKVKVVPKAREVQAFYEFDEQTMCITVQLPPSWPLGQAKIEGNNRIAIEEKKWGSWNRTVGGMIAFGNGSIVDALSVWQKNVAGALKGKTECAICYSVVSGSREVPNKKCKTCKQPFHGSCLHKWFSTSNLMSCPLCRSAFFGGPRRVAHDAWVPNQ